jgi:hypothetical protein
MAPLYEIIINLDIMFVAYVTYIIFKKMKNLFFEHMAVKRRYFTTLSTKAILISKSGVMCKSGDCHPKPKFIFLIN